MRDRFGHAALARLQSRASDEQRREREDEAEHHEEPGAQVPLPRELQTVGPLLLLEQLDLALALPRLELRLELSHLTLHV